MKLFILFTLISVLNLCVKGKGGTVNSLTTVAFGYKCGKQQIQICKDFVKSGTQCTCPFRKGKEGYNVCKSKKFKTECTEKLSKGLKGKVGNIMESLCFNFHENCNESTDEKNKCLDFCNNKGFKCNSKYCDSLKTI